MYFIDVSFKNLMLSAATGQRLLTVALLGALANVLLTVNDQQLLLNVTLLGLVCWGCAQSRRDHAPERLTLNWWRKVCYWLLLNAIVLWFIATLHVTYLNTGVATGDPAQVNLAAISAAMVSLITGGLLYLFEA
ncbi:hypothetical protein D1831_02830 [Lactiplantibacillus garii]|uniref:Uncharacterized protein n=1 Tax=Lactiplantibacillus garii TaxID=2306423 RepID=A0A3R8J8Y3_9LACO|nr:hypothetical protein [Lactiplantibacillus garii]RRK11328.1 hypothetical protein D1831_02830 [Lactiplantibacillus garii]